MMATKKTKAAAPKAAAPKAAAPKAAAPKAKRLRMAPADRKAAMAVQIVALLKKGEKLRELTRDKVAKHCGVSDALVTYYFGNMEQFRAGAIATLAEQKELPTLRRVAKEGFVMPKKIAALL